MIDREKSSALRRALAVTDPPKRAAPSLATPEEMFTLRSYLEMGAVRFAEWLGVHATMVTYWEIRRMPVNPRKPAVRAQLERALAEFRALNIPLLTMPAEPKERRARYQCRECAAILPRRFLRRRIIVVRGTDYVEFEHWIGERLCGVAILDHPMLPELVRKARAAGGTPMIDARDAGGTVAPISP